MSELYIPDEELLEEFAGLPEACRCEVRAALRTMERLLKTGSRGIGKALAKHAPQMGVSARRLRTIYDLFRHTKDWRVLVDERRYPQVLKGGNIPGPVLELWRTLCERNQRKCKPAYRELIRLWERGEPKGLEWPARDPHTGKPRGCTYRNLLRKASTPYELKLARIGRGAASAMLPKVLTTRADLLVGQMYICDDQDYDVNVAFAGVNRKMTRPSGFNTLDAKSAAEILQGYKPTVLNPDGSKQKLRQVDYQWHLVSLLTTVGFRTDTGTIIVGEHGTAKAGKDFEERVRLATGGKGSFTASGIHGEQLAGLFRGQPRGNPRYKASRESWFNLLRNEMAALPGPSGMDRAHAPEENYGLEKYTRDLLDAISARPELAEALQLPVLRWPAFVALTDFCVRQINARTDHELEGWAECLADEWRFAVEMPWLPAAQLLALPGPQRSVAEGLIQVTPGLWRVRRMSPWEVWESGRTGLTRIAGAMVPVLLGPDGARPARVTNDHQLLLEDGEIDPEPMWFDAELTNGRMLGQRQEVLAYLNPFAPEALEVCDPAGRWLGTAPRVHRLSKLDAEALQRRYGQVRRIEGRLMAPVAARGAKLARERTAMHAHNGRLLAETGAAEERQQLGSFARAAQSRPASRPVEADELAEVFGSKPEATFTPEPEAEGGITLEELREL